METLDVLQVVLVLPQEQAGSKASPTSILGFHCRIARTIAVMSCALCPVKARGLKHVNFADLEVKVVSDELPLILRRKMGSNIARHSNGELQWQQFRRSVDTRLFASSRVGLM